MRELEGGALSSRLLEDALGGDEAAFCELYRDVHPRLLRYAQALIGDEAEDVMSEVWLQVARDLPHFSGGPMQFRAWTARIVRNRTIDALRAQARRPKRGADLSQAMNLAAPNDTAEAVEEAWTTTAALALIASLPRVQAEAVLLRAVVGLDPVSAAKIMGKRPGAVRTAAHRGLRTLAQKLESRPVAVAGEHD